MDRSTELDRLFRVKQNLEAQYNNGIVPEPQYRAELKSILARIKELGG